MPVRGWCPSLFEPMASGDGLLVRVKPPLGRLTAAQARWLGEACARHGNGTIELTGRGNLQCRGFDERSAALFAASVVDAGLASADPAAERRRTVLTPPDGRFDQLATAMERSLEGASDLAALPAKFGVVINDGTMPSGDIAIDGSMAEPEAIDAVLRLARAFLALGGTRRMADLVAQVGEAAIFATAGLSPLPLAGEGWVRMAGPARSSVSLADPTSPISGRGGVIGFGLPFGRFDAEALAGLSERCGNAIRLAPWRSVVIAGASRAEAAALGLIVDANDPRRRVSACPGAPACAAATVETRALAAALRPVATVHVSGCEKGCAHPGSAALTFVGRDGRFDLVRDGRAGDPPVRRGLSPAEVLAA